MSTAKRDRRRSDLAKFIETYRKLGLPEGSAFEQAIWVILARNGSREGASRATQAIWERFLDVNELRIVQLSEIAPLIAPYVRNDPEDVAYYARAPMREIIRTEHQMALGFAEEMTADQLRKYLSSLDSCAREVALVMLMHFCRLEIEAAEPVAEGDGEPKPRKRLEKEITLSANRLRVLFTFAAHGSMPSGAREVNSSRAFLKTWTTFGPLPPRPKPEPEPVPQINLVELKREVPGQKRKRKGAPAVGKAPAAGIPRKTAAVRTTGKSQPEASRTMARKAPPTGAVSKKAALGRAVPKKAVAKKTVPKKTVAKKTVSKKAASKKAVSKKAVSKKAVSKKAVGKKAVRKTGATKGPSRGGSETRPRTTRTARKRATNKKSSRRS